MLKSGHYYKYSLINWYIIIGLKKAKLKDGWKTDENEIQYDEPAAGDDVFGDILRDNEQGAFDVLIATLGEGATEVISN